MFRELRRKDKKMDNDKIEEILINSEYGTLACLGDDGYPYAIPLNYYYEDNAVYFHSALKGHKIDAMLNDPKVSFSIVNGYKIMPEDLNTHFESVIVFGKASIVKDKEKSKNLYNLGMKYSFDFEKIVNDAVEKEFEITALVKIQIEHKEGKIAQ
ncbi:MAG: pyridoxamine 5'-phosphate oxidase family protein [Bacillota bacterium]|nr:pyridoxamine 5'-phosphate oxidase family protein [Bacillota bacterium]